MSFQTVFWSLLQTLSSYTICYSGTSYGPDRYGPDREFPVIALELRVMSLESKDAVAHSSHRYSKQWTFPRTLLLLLWWNTSWTG